MKEERKDGGNGEKPIEEMTEERQEEESMKRWMEEMYVSAQMHYKHVFVYEQMDEWINKWMNE